MTFKIDDTYTLGDNQTLELLPVTTLNNVDNVPLELLLIADITEYIETRSDSITLSDVVSHLLDIPVTRSDSITLSDVVSHLLDIPVTRSDTITFNDNASFLLEMLLDLNDSTTFTDNNSIVVDYTQTQTDTVNFTVAEEHERIYGTLQSDTLNVNDDNESYAEYVNDLSSDMLVFESQLITDFTEFVAQITDVLQIQGVCTDVGNFINTQSDTITVEENEENIVEFVTNQDDTVILNTTEEFEVQYIVTNSDTITFGEQQSFIANYEIAQISTVNINDNIDTEFTFVITQSDTVTVFDTTQFIAEFVDHSAQSHLNIIIFISEIFNEVATYVTVRTDSINFSVNSQYVADYDQGFDSTLTFNAPELSNNVAFYETPVDVSEEVLLSVDADFVLIAEDYLDFENEIVFEDDAIAGSDFIGSGSSTITLLDNQDAFNIVITDFSDAVIFSDVNDGFFEFLQNLESVITLTDNHLVITNYVTSLLQSISFTSQIKNVVANYITQTSISLTLSDVPIDSFDVEDDLFEQFEFDDSTFVYKEFTDNQLDIIEIIDEVEDGDLVGELIFTDTIAFTFNVSDIVISIDSITETLNYFETVDTILDALNSVIDALLVQDNKEISADYTITQQDSVLITDNLLAFNTITHTFVDDITFTDFNDFVVEFRIQPSDTITFTDNRVSVVDMITAVSDSIIFHKKRIIERYDYVDFRSDTLTLSDTTKNVGQTILVGVTSDIVQFTDSVDQISILVERRKDQFYLSINTFAFLAGGSTFNNTVRDRITFSDKKPITHLEYVDALVDLLNLIDTNNTIGPITIVFEEDIRPYVLDISAKYRIKEI